MSHSKRLSQSLNGSWSDTTSLTFLSGSDNDAEKWTETWKTVYARDLIDSRIVTVDAETSVEDACDKLSSEDVPCLVIKDGSQQASRYLGLFDYSDVNAFLTLAATRHTFSLDGSDADPRRDRIVEAAKAGPVPVSLVSNLSDKNPLICLEHDANIIDLLKAFCRGNHRVLIQTSEKDGACVGMVSDRGLLSWFAVSAKSAPSFEHYLSNFIHPLSFPSSNAHNSVIASFSSSTILDAMRLMSDEGVSSIAVLDDETGALLSTVSVTDVGKHVVPSQSNQFLSTPLHQFISVIKDPDGSTDGVDKYPVYSVRPSSQLLYTIEKILATNAHRVFVARESTLSSPVLGPAAVGNLCGIVSIVDILALFATLAGISNVDPTEMQRHRRQSSSASSSSRSLSDFQSRSRSNSTSAVQIQRSPSILSLGSPIVSPGISALSEPSPPSLAGIESIIQVAVPERRRSLRTNKATAGAGSVTVATQAPGTM